MMLPLIQNERQTLLVPGNKQETLTFATNHFLEIATKAIDTKGTFSVALSGGSTPKALFEALSAPPYNTKIDWSKVALFWSDERSVPPQNSESNYHMAMEAGLKNLVPSNQIHRMHAEEDIEKNAKAYEALIDTPFDLVMLGMGEDGHTASLFPGTEALLEEEALVAKNYVPQKKTWRMTLTYRGIHYSKNIAIYVLGTSKKEMLHKIFTANEGFPIEKVGTKKCPATWIADLPAAELLMHE